MHLISPPQNGYSYIEEALSSPMVKDAHVWKNQGVIGSQLFLSKRLYRRSFRGVPSWQP